MVLAVLGKKTKASKTARVLGKSYVRSFLQEGEVYGTRGLIECFQEWAQIQRLGIMSPQSGPIISLA